MDIIVKLATAPVPTGPSQYRAEFLREQVCSIPVAGKVLRRVFVGV